MAESSQGIEAGDDDPPPIGSTEESATSDANPEEKSNASLISSSDSNSTIVQPQPGSDSADVDVDIGTKFEEILDDLGAFGKYQKLVVFLVVLPAIFANGVLGSSWIFLVASPAEYWCTIPKNDSLVKGNSSYVPSQSDSCGSTEESRANKCCMYDVDYAEVWASGYTGKKSVVPFLNGTVMKNTRLKKCSEGWTYDKSFLHSSIVTDFDLVCEHDYLPTLGYIVPSIGGIVGIVAGGYISDKFGRKKSFFLFLVLLLTFGPAVSLSSSFPMYVALATLASIPSNPLYTIPYSLGLEVITPSMRITYSVLITVAFTMGGIALVGFAYFFRYWKIIMLASVLPSVFFLGLWTIMPESPRWLLSEGRFKELQKYLRVIGKFNRRRYSVEIGDKVAQLQALRLRTDESNLSKTSFLDLFRTRSVFLKTVLLSYLSFCVSTVYVGLYYYAPGLGSNPFLNLLLSSLIELPSSLLTETIANRLGRKITLLLCLLFGVASMLGTAGVPSAETHYVSLLILFCLARLFMTSAYTVQELMMYESYPTSLRGEAVSFITLFSYVVSSFGPLIVHFRYGDFSLPFMVFGGMTIVALGCVLLLPETSGPLKESLDTASDKTSWRSICVFLPLNGDKPLPGKIFPVES